MRVLFAGSPAVAVPALQQLLSSDHDVVGVLTRKPAPVGRKRVLTPTAVHQVALQHQLPVITEPPHHSLAQIQALQPDIVAVVAYGALIKEPALSAIPHGWVNLHFSLLPAWRGAAPVQYAIMAGDDLTGASTFQIEAGLDTGPVFGVMTERIRPEDTAGDLLERLAEGGAPLLLSTLDAIADGSARPQPQSSDGISHAPQLHAADARISPSRSAHVIDRHIRGLTPAPGAWLEAQGERYKIGPVRLVAEPAEFPLDPGQVAAHQDEILMGTGAGVVALQEIAPPGKRWMKAADWFRGARLPQDWRFDV